MNKTWPKILFCFKLNNNNRMLSSTVTTRWQNIGSGGATLKLKGFRLKLLLEKFNFTRVESQRVLYVTDDREGSVPIPASTECFLRPTLQSGPETQLFFSFLFFRVFFFFLPWEAESVAKVLLGENFSHSESKGGELKSLPCLSLPSFLCSVPLVPLTWEKTLQWKTEFYSNPEETVWLSEAKT